MNFYTWDGETPRGHRVEILCRQGTNDQNISSHVLGSDEYRLQHLDPEPGWAIDIGAHIGSATLVMAIDLGLCVAAVEPVPENRALLAYNAWANGVGDRVTILPFAAGTGNDLVPIRYDRDGGQRYVGNLDNIGATVEHVRPIGITSILDRIDVARVSLMKIDCEGCEWDVLRDPGVAYVDTIVGEYHGDPEQLHTLLPQHDVEMRGYTFKAAR